MKQIILIILCAGAVMISAEEDRWFGRDKAQHFLVSAVSCAGARYYLSTKAGLERGHAIAWGIGFSFTLGVSKEIYDKRRGSFISLRDMVYDLAGTAAGAWILWPSHF
jgi:putative lipoprotein